MARRKQKLETRIRKPTHTIPAKPKLKAIKPKNPKQEEYLDALDSKAIVFGIGCAGTGKTLLPIFVSLERLLNNEIEKIYITKPTVEVGNSLGFMPGKMSDKFGVYLQSMLDHCYELIGKPETHRLISEGKIVPLPIQFMRGVTLTDCDVIGDEFQNATYIQTKTLLTRIGENCSIYLTGDMKQCDIDSPRDFERIIEIIAPMEDCAVVKFSAEHVERSGLAKKIIQMFENSEES